MYKAEHLMYAIREYVQAGSVTKQWIEDLANPVGARDPSLKWAMQMFCSARLVSLGQTAAAFRSINACCAEYRDIAGTLHPGLFPALVNVLFVLESVDPALAGSFLFYALDLGDAIFPPNHPVQLLSATFKCSGLAGVRAFARFVLEGYKAAVQGSVGRHRGAVGRDISTHLLAYQGWVEFAEDIVRGKGIMDTTVEHWPKWFRVSLASCDPSFVPMARALEDLLAESRGTPPSGRGRLSGERLSERWDDLCKQICDGFY